MIDIARLLCQGRKASAMAAPLKISVNTIKTHLRRLFKKCRVHDRVSFVALVFYAAQAKNG
jgi:DNA-binding NarL/FixJ family response regulator